MLRLITILTLLFHCTVGAAQSIKAYREYPKPEVLLIRLPTYNQRYKTYLTAGYIKGAEQIIKDAAAIQSNMISDFKENFTFCEYYFFYDTMNGEILKKNFAGNLYDKNLKPVTTSPLSTEDTTYQIVYWGYYLSEQSEITPYLDKLENKEHTYYTGMKRLRLVLVNHTFGRLADPLPNGTFYSRNPMLFNIYRKKNKQPIGKKYTSPKFDLYYTESAKDLSTDLNTYYNLHRVL